MARGEAKRVEANLQLLKYFLPIAKPAI